MRVNKICPYCKENFLPKRSNQIYCTSKHGWDHRNEKKVNVWDNRIFKYIKSNDELLKAVYENSETNGVCSWRYLLSLGFHKEYITHQKTMGFLKFNVMLKYGYLRSENGNTTIKEIYE